MLTHFHHSVFFATPAKSSILSYMHWVIIALVAPLLWSLLNHADKYLIGKYAHDTGIVGLMIFSSLFALLALPVIYGIDHTVIAVGSQELAPLLTTGLLIAFGILLYLYALKREDASHVVPFWFLIPIFGYIFGISFLDEHLATLKIIGSIITIAGAFILSLEFEGKVSIKKIPALLMIGSGILIALSDVMFKGLTAEHSFWTTVFWNQAGFALFGIICFFFIPRYRREFIQVCSMRSTELVILNISTELVTIIANIVSYYSMTLAPVAVVLLLSYTFQPLFVFFEGLLLTRFLPRVSHEHLSRKHIAQKIIAILIMGAGTYLVIL
jgi:drug/metabolite transporter (DMT)-like permease